MSTLDALKYPIGKWKKEFNEANYNRSLDIESIADFPDTLADLVDSEHEKILEKTYREGGWTVRQLVHHCADSHTHAYLRFKFALAEENTTIKPYVESSWATLTDYHHMPVKYSLEFIQQLHRRWTWLMTHMSELDWNRTYFHPESNRLVPLKEALNMYSWHGKHHLAHIKIALFAK